MDGVLSSFTRTFSLDATGARDITAETALTVRPGGQQGGGLCLRLLLGLLWLLLLVVAVVVVTTMVVRLVVRVVLMVVSGHGGRGGTGGSGR